MKVTMKIDGNCGLHTKVIDMPEEVVKGLSTLTIKGLDFNVSTQYDVDSGELTAIAYYFFSKDENIIDLSEWTPEEGGFLEAKKQLAELMEKW